MEKSRREEQRGLQRPIAAGAQGVGSRLNVVCGFCSSVGLVNRVDVCRLPP